MLDIEVPTDWKKIPKDARIKLVIDWLTAVETKLGVTPIVYGNGADLRALLKGDPSFARFPLWLANYNKVSQPPVPAPWKNWTFWQHTQSGTVSGVAGPCDLDRFQGSLSELRKLTK